MDSFSIVSGSPYFVSYRAAVKYYATSVTVDDKIAAGEIYIGRPPLKNNQRIAYIRDGHYFVGVVKGDTENVA